MTEPIDFKELRALAEKYDAQDWLPPEEQHASVRFSRGILALLATNERLQHGFDALVDCLKDHPCPPARTKCVRCDEPSWTQLCYPHFVKFGPPPDPPDGTVEDTTEADARAAAVGVGRTYLE